MVKQEGKDGLNDEDKQRYEDERFRVPLTAMFKRSSSAPAAPGRIPILGLPSLEVNSGLLAATLNGYGQPFSVHGHVNTAHRAILPANPAGVSHGKPGGEGNDDDVKPGGDGAVSSAVVVCLRFMSPFAFVPLLSHI